MIRSPFKMDERNLFIALRVTAVMYFITIGLIIAALFYRQFVLYQDSDQFDDLAMILVFNSVFFIMGILYFGGIPINKIKPKTVILGYIAFAFGGFAFTYIKYTFLTDHKLSFSQILDKSYIVAVICAIFVLLYLLFAYFGKKRSEKEIED